MFNDQRLRSTPTAMRNLKIPCPTELGEFGRDRGGYKHGAPDGADSIWIKLPGFLPVDVYNCKLLFDPRLRKKA